MKKIIFTLSWVLAFTSCTQKKAETTISSSDILINQVAYQVDAPKYALLRTPGTHYSVTAEDGKEIIAGKVEAPKYWALAGDTVSMIDLSRIKSEGIYTLHIDKDAALRKFAVRQHPLSALSKTALKSFYWNRSGYAIEDLYGEKWTRAAGHPDTTILVHASAADEKRPEGTTLSMPGGWYDAGDYNKYIVNSSITCYTLLKAYEMAPEYHQNMQINIPESGADLPDILAETLYNLKWMLLMQDPNDGGVYHKLTTKNFEGFVMPDEATNQRYVVQKSTAAALDFAATMAMASRVYSQFENYQSLSHQMLEQAKYAWQWALSNNNISYEQPKDISTGAYGDEHLEDEWFWAAAELYLSTKESLYKEVVVKYIPEVTTPAWGDVGTLGVISLITSKEASNFEDMQEAYVHYCRQLLNLQKQSPYLISMEKFEWGSNSTVANEAMLKLITYHLLQDKTYLQAAREDVNYLLGRNATGYCFVTGFGEVSPKHIHHRPSAADRVEDPVPGFLVGGPNTVVLNDCGDKVERSSYPAKSYIDAECSYSTNEIAINWNAPLVFITSFIDAQDAQ